MGVTRHYRVWLISGCAFGTSNLAEGRRVTLDRHGSNRRLAPGGLGRSGFGGGFHFNVLNVSGEMSELKGRLRIIFHARGSDGIISTDTSPPID